MMNRKQIELGMWLVVLSCGVMTNAGCEKSGQSETKQAEPATQPKPVGNMTVQQVNDLMTGKNEYVFLDVRTVEEFEAGHPAGTLNIPVLIKDASTGKKIKNEKFLDVVIANIPKFAKVIVGCRSGRRSTMAANMMHAVGYQHVDNMLGGFSGQFDSEGKVIHPGWQSKGYPTETGLGGNRSYEVLKNKAGS